MPKIFTPEDKERHRTFLMEKGLALIAKNGYRKTTVDDLAKLAGVSKGYFYLLFPSKEDFILDALLYQMEKEYLLLEDAVSQNCDRQSLREIHINGFKGQSHLNPEDMSVVIQKLKPSQWRRFKDAQFNYFKRILLLLGKDPEKCDPKLISNLAAIAFLSAGSAQELPYLFEETIQETTEIILKAIHQYIAAH